jgi:hypothetical protein
VFGGHPAFGEAGGVDDVCIRRLGALVDELENGSLKVGGKGGYRDAQSSSEALAEVLQVLQRCLFLAPRFVMLGPSIITIRRSRFDDRKPTKEVGNVIKLRSLRFDPLATPPVNDRY